MCLQVRYASKENTTIFHPLVKVLFEKKTHVSNCLSNNRHTNVIAFKVKKLANYVSIKIARDCVWQFAICCFY